MLISRRRRRRRRRRLRHRNTLSRCKVHWLSGNLIQFASSSPSPSTNLIRRWEVSSLKNNGEDFEYRYFRTPARRSNINQHLSHDKLNSANTMQPTCSTKIEKQPQWKEENRFSSFVALLLPIVCSKFMIDTWEIPSTNWTTADTTAPPSRFSNQEREVAELI